MELAPRSPNMTLASRLFTLLSTIIALWATGGISQRTKWHLAETYDSSNFFDKFDFITERSRPDSYAVYQNKSEAFKKGLAAYRGDRVYIGPDYNTVLPSGSGPGRDTVRIESKKRYNHGLLITRILHEPKVKCDVYSYFRTYGDEPKNSIIHFIKRYNTNSFNEPGFRVSDTDGHRCRLLGENQTAGVWWRTCGDVLSEGRGCVASELRGLESWQEPKAGSVYAMEWTSDFIKLYGWVYSKAPRNVGDDSPDTSTWGLPVVHLKNKDCEIDRYFSDQRIVFNLDFCNLLPEDLPKPTDMTCQKKTGLQCTDNVARNPNAFRESFFEIKDIRYFQDTSLASSRTSTPSDLSYVAPSPPKIDPVLHRTPTSSDIKLTIFSSTLSLGAAASTTEKSTGSAVPMKPSMTTSSATSSSSSSAMFHSAPPTASASSKGLHPIAPLGGASPASATESPAKVSSTTTDHSKPAVSSHSKTLSESIGLPRSSSTTSPKYCPSPKVSMSSDALVALGDESHRPDSGHLAPALAETKLLSPRSANPDQRWYINAFAHQGREKAEREKAEREKAEREKAERERTERERTEKEKAASKEQSISSSTASTAHPTSPNPLATASATNYSHTPRHANPDPRVQLGLSILLNRERIAENERKEAEERERKRKAEEDREKARKAEEEAEKARKAEEAKLKEALKEQSISNSATLPTHPTNPSPPTPASATGSSHVTAPDDSGDGIPLGIVRIFRGSDGKVHTGTPTKTWTKGSKRPKRKRPRKTTTPTESGSSFTASETPETLTALAPVKPTAEPTNSHSEARPEAAALIRPDSPSRSPGAGDSSATTPCIESSTSGDFPVPSLGAPTESSRSRTFASATGYTDSSASSQDPKASASTRQPPTDTFHPSSIISSTSSSLSCRNSSDATASRQSTGSKARNIIAPASNTPASTDTVSKTSSQWTSTSPMSLERSIHHGNSSSRATRSSTSIKSGSSIKSLSLPESGRITDSGSPADSVAMTTQSSGSASDSGATKSAGSTKTSSFGSDRRTDVTKTTTPSAETTRPCIDSNSTVPEGESLSTSVSSKTITAIPTTIQPNEVSKGRNASLSAIPEVDAPASPKFAKVKASKTLTTKMSTTHVSGSTSVPEVELPSVASLSHRRDTGPATQSIRTEGSPVSSTTAGCSPGATSCLAGKVTATIITETPRSGDKAGDPGSPTTSPKSTFSRFPPESVATKSRPIEPPSHAGDIDNTPDSPEHAEESQSRHGHAHGTAENPVNTLTAPGSPTTSPKSTPSRFSPESTASKSRHTEPPSHTGHTQDAPGSVGRVDVSKSRPNYAHGTLKSPVVTRNASDSPTTSLESASNQFRAESTAIKGRPIHPSFHIGHNGDAPDGLGPDLSESRPTYVHGTLQRPTTTLRLVPTTAVAVQGRPPFPPSHVGDTGNAPDGRVHVDKPESRPSYAHDTIQNLATTLESATTTPAATEHHSMANPGIMADSYKNVPQAAHDSNTRDAPDGPGQFHGSTSRNRDAYSTHQNRKTAIQSVPTEHVAAELLPLASPSAVANSLESVRKTASSPVPASFRATPAAADRPPDQALSEANKFPGTTEHVRIVLSSAVVFGPLPATSGVAKDSPNRPPSRADSVNDRHDTSLIKDGPHLGESPAPPTAVKFQAGGGSARAGDTIDTPESAASGAKPAFDPTTAISVAVKGVPIQPLSRPGKAVDVSGMAATKPEPAVIQLPTTPVEVKAMSGQPPQRLDTTPDAHNSPKASVGPCLNRSCVTPITSEGISNRPPPHASNGINIADEPADTSLSVLNLPLSTPSSYSRPAFWHHQPVISNRPSSHAFNGTDTSRGPADTSLLGLKLLSSTPSATEHSSSGPASRHHQPAVSSLPRTERSHATAARSSTDKTTLTSSPRPNSNAPAIVDDKPQVDAEPSTQGCVGDDCLQALAISGSATRITLSAWMLFGLVVALLL